jgi:hypothetical protein
MVSLDLSHKHCGGDKNKQQFKSMQTCTKSLISIGTCITFKHRFDGTKYSNTHTAKKNLLRLYLRTNRVLP